MSTIEWYYLRDGQQIGPVGSKELKSLADRGRLQPTDLIWRDGLPNWVPAARVKGLFPETDVYSLEEEPAPPVTSAPVDQDEEFAPERVRPKGRKALRHGYAGFWKRFAAFIIDMILLLALGFGIGVVIGIVLAITMGPGRAQDAIDSHALLFNLLGIIINWLYYALLESSESQATIGKRAMHIKVVDEEGYRISFARATGRYFAKILSAIILLIGFIMAAFTPRKQALHDYLAHTLVVND
jgi:uncharacterized RDD family membrane protein YckC